MNTDASKPSKVWLIEKNYHFRNHDNYPTDRYSIELDEGFFISQEAANQRAIELNGNLPVQGSTEFIRFEAVDVELASAEEAES